MFLSIWNYWRGYVIINVWGFSVERFMNLATHKGIYLWDIKKKRNVTEMKVSIQGFKLLKQCARKTKCKVTIIEKKGWPFVAHRYRKRRLFALGIIVCLCLLYFLSSYVWIVDIQGNDRVSKEEILETLDRYGVGAGVRKRSIRVEEFGHYLMQEIKEISWVAAHIKGTRLFIELVETVPKPEFIDIDTPCNIVADKKGVIVSIATSAGTPIVKAKDVVEEGDILVSGELLIKQEEEVKDIQYVHALADIKAKVWYVFKEEQDISYMDKQYTDEVKKHYGVIYFNKQKIFLKPSISFENYDKMSNKNQISFGKDFVLPFGWVVEEYHEYIPQVKKYTDTEIKQKLQKKLEKKIKESLHPNAEIVERSLEFEKDRKAMKAMAKITVIEPIGKEEEITIKERRNLLNGTDGENDSH
ncbi:MAG: sporulation protein YqfD [Epulopiscium sp.]|nr:sporulation protein YqfD [Candidatus Epulonipiscium sp.]